MPDNIASAMQVIVFSRPMCSDCTRLEEQFARDGVVYDHKNVLADEAAKTEARTICESLGRPLALPVVVLRDLVPDGHSDIVFIEPQEPQLEVLHFATRAYSSSVGLER